MLVVRKSVANYIQRRWGTPALKKSESRREAFLRIKAALMRHCKQKMLEAKREEGSVKKAIADLVRLEKARRVYNIGETAIWGGKKYIKGADKKWRRKYETGFKQTKGGAKAWQNILAKMDTINDERELMWFVESNKMRFVDNAGLPLPEVEELSKLAHARNDEIVARKDAAAKGKTESVTPSPRSQEEQSAGDEAKLKQVQTLSNVFEAAELRFFLEWRKNGNRKNNANYERHLFFEWYRDAVRKVVDNIKAGNFSDKDAVALKDAKKGAEKEREKVLKTIRSRFGKDAWKWAATGADTKVGGCTPELRRSVNLKELRFLDQALGLLNSKELSELIDKADESATKQTESVKPAPAKEEAKPVTGLDRIRQQYNSSRAIEGREGKIILSDGSKVAGRWRIVEADAPSASHNEETFNKTEGFPTNPDGSTINDRDYEHDRDAQMSVISMAGEYDGRALKDPVVVSKDGVVISGNNRTMSGKLAAKNGTDGEYIEWLKDQCDMYKIDPSDLDDFKHPRLIFEIDTKEYSTKQFAAYNASDKKAQSPVEQAVKVAKTVKLETVTSIARKMAEYETMGDLYADKSTMREIFNSLIEGGVIQQFDLPQYFAEDSGASDNGKEFLETVLIGSVINAGNLRSLAAPGGKSIRQKLVRAIVPLVENKGMKGYSINDELNEGIRIACYVAQNKDKMRSVKDYGSQISLDGSRPDKLAVEFAKKLESSSQKGFAEFMQEINAGLRSPASGQFDLVLGRAETRGEVLSRILNTTIDKSLLRSLCAIRKSIARARRIAQRG